MAEVLVRLLRKHSCKKEALICGNTGRRAKGDGLEAMLAPETTQGRDVLEIILKSQEHLESQHLVEVKGKTIDFGF